MKALVPMGRFNVDIVMRWLAAAAAAATEAELVAAPEGCGRQLLFWHVMLRVCSGEVAIPEVADMAAAGALEAFTDAAGGSADSPGNGTGGVLGGWWFYVPWSVRIRAGGWRVDGVKVSRKLSALELVGPLVVVAAAADQLRNRRLVIWVDNAGSVAIWRKGYSNKCRLSSTLVAAMAAVAAGLGCQVEVVKITRCSSKGAVLADLVSKARFWEFRERCMDWGLNMSAAPARVPPVLLEWVCLPRPDDYLGHHIL